MTDGNDALAAARDALEFVGLEPTPEKAQKLLRYWQMVENGLEDSRIPPVMRFTWRDLLEEL